MLSTPNQPLVNDAVIFSIPASGDCGDEKTPARVSVVDKGFEIINEKCSAASSVADIVGISGVEESLAILSVARDVGHSGDEYPCDEFDHMAGDDASIGSHSSGSCSIDSCDLGPPSCSTPDRGHGPPPGSLLYKCDVAPPSPTNIMDFSDDPATEDLPDSDDFGGAYDVNGLSLLPVFGSIRVCNIDTDRSANKSWEIPTRTDILPQRAKGGLSDTGANICMTNQMSLLLNVRQLHNPIPVGVALNVEGSKVANSVCTHVGDLPLPLTSGEYFYQKCYYNPSATDTFLSPHAVWRDSDGLLDDWAMTARTSTGEGNLTISSPTGL